MTKYRSFYTRLEIHCLAPNELYTCTFWIHEQITLTILEQINFYQKYLYFENNLQKNQYIALKTNINKEITHLTLTNPNVLVNDHSHVRTLHYMTYYWNHYFNAGLTRTFWPEKYILMYLRTKYNIILWILTQLV